MPSNEEMKKMNDLEIEKLKNQLEIDALKKQLARQEREKQKQEQQKEIERLKSRLNADVEREKLKETSSTREFNESVEESKASFERLTKRLAKLPSLSKDEFDKFITQALYSDPAIRPSRKRLEARLRMGSEFKTHAQLEIVQESSMAASDPVLARLLRNEAVRQDLEIENRMSVLRNKDDHAIAIWDRMRIDILKERAASSDAAKEFYDSACARIGSFGLWTYC